MVSLLKKDVSILFLLFVVSSIIRFKINFSTEFIPGNNGAFYLLLNRDILENGNLHYRDFPLLFYLQSFFAFILIKINLLNLNQAVDFVSRTFDSFVPTLAVIPAYLLSKKIIGNEKSSSIIFSLIAIFHFSFFNLISDFQKNSLGILWLFWLIYFLFKTNDLYNFKNLGYTILFFVLTGLTHFGCFGVAILIVGINLLVVGLAKLSTKYIYKFLTAAFFLIIFSFGLVYLINPFRFYSLIGIIKNTINEPIIVMLVQKKPIVSSLEILGIILINVLAVTSMVILIRNKKDQNKNYFLTICIAALFLSSPLLNYEIAQRLYFISYITLIPLSAFVYKNANTQMIKTIILYLSLVIIFFSSVLNFNKPVYSNMNAQLYTDLNSIKSKISFNKKSIIISRHGLDYWLMWILRVDAIRKEEVTEDYWKWYDDIYIIRQKKFKPPFGPAGIFGLPFKDPPIIENTKPIYSSNYFDLYKVLTKPNDYSIFKDRL